MSSFDPPLYNSDVFNPALFSYSSGSLSISDADKRYLKLSGGTIGGSLAITGSLTVSTLSLTNLTATNITGTIQTAAQPNITSLGTLSSLSVSGSISGTLSTASQPNITSLGTLTGLTNSGSETLNGTSSVLSLSGASAYISISNTNASTNATSGALRCSGGAYFGADSVFNTKITCGTINATTIQQSGVSYTLSSFLTAVPSTISITSMTASTVSCTTLNQGGTSYNLSTFMTTGGSPTFANITCTTLNCSTNTYKADLRLSPISGSYGFRCYDTQTSDYATMQFYTANRSSGVLTEYRTYFVDLGSQLIYGSPLQISFQEGSSVASGYRIATQNVGAQTTSNSNLILGSGQYRNMVVVNGYTNTVNIQSVDLVNNNYNTQCIIGDGSGNALWCRGKVHILNSGGALGSANLNILDGTAGSTNTTFRMGNNESAYNYITQTWKPVGAGNSGNCLTWDSSGVSNILCVRADGRVGIGTTSPKAGLHVATTNSIVIGTGGTANAYAYDVSSNVWSSFGLGPYTGTNISAFFQGHILVRTGLYCESDRRRKEDIKTIDITLEHYDKLRPVSYRYIGETNTKLGLVAQEAMKVSRELISIYPNESLKVEDPESDIEGYQFTLDYGSLSALNAAAIKLLIKRVKELEAKLSSL